MLAELLGVVVIFAIAVGIACVALVAPRFVAPRRDAVAKQATFDASASRPARGQERQRFPVKFYPAAIAFLVFQVAVVYFYPWAAAFSELGSPALAVIAVFSVPLVVGFVYQWMKGVFEW